MEIQEILKKINQSVDNLDLVSARRYIEKNIEQVSQNRHHLCKNARDLLGFLQSDAANATSVYNRRELHMINTINTYATRFDVRGLRLSVKNNADLLLKKDIRLYLNADAKILLEGMKAIQAG
ncbi:hypothetical protein [Sporosarcina sp. YIM B06819]|uniref:hypothetical protein n=1 Tax=Sporosarcina sp. YIM B06819 TaxID=3081769 RepID=UPI00298C776B|nr:hypothetical protein [Sporosarcina sp. YIM B06819]